MWIKQMQKNVKGSNILYNHRIRFLDMGTSSQ